MILNFGLSLTFAFFFNISEAAVKEKTTKPISQNSKKSDSKKLNLYLLAQNDTQSTNSEAESNSPSTESANDSTETPVPTESAESSETSSSEQSNSKPSKSNTQDADALVEEEQVVSSRLKKMDISGASPEMSITGDAITKSGYNSVSDMLRDSPISSTGAGRESSGSTRAGLSEVDLRGLGSSNTLVLINGMRMAPIAGSDTVNINRIPVGMIKDVKIIKDDLSSIYGSDAIGGVMNIITHDSYNDFTVSGGATATHLGGGERYDFNILGGKSTSKTNFVYSLSFRRNNNIYSRDRRWTNNVPSTIGSPGSYRNTGSSTWHAADDCPSDRILTTAQGSFCTINTADYSTSLPLLEQSSAYGRLEHKLNNQTTVFLDLMFSSLNASYVYAPTPGSFSVPASVAQTYGLDNYISGSDLDVQYRTLELGNRDSFQREDFYNITTGLKWDFLDTWSGKFAMTYGYENKKDRNEGNSIVSSLEGLLTQPAPGGGFMFMPFNPAGDRGDLSSAYYEPWARETANFYMADLRFEGELMELAGRPVVLTVGESYVFRDYMNEVDAASENNETLSGAGSSGKADRFFFSTYAQIEANLTPKLDLFLAGRYDKFSDFGDTFNPKVGFRYKVTNDLMWRSTVGTGFKAPALSTLYASSSDSFRRFIDYKACEQDGTPESCSPRQYRVLSSGNENLSEITSFSYNTGLVYSPTTNLNLSLDFWSVTQKGIAWGPGDQSLEDVTRAEVAGIDPSVYNIHMNRDANGYLDNTNPIVASTQDLSYQKTGGLDFELSYVLPVPIGSIRFGEMMSYRLWDITSVFPGLPDRDWVKEHWVNRWRNNVNISYVLLGHSLGITVVSTDKFQNAVKNGYVDSYHRFDLAYSYSGFDKLNLTIGVQNFLGTTPPLDMTNPQAPLATSLYSEVGPLVYSNVKYTF